MSTHSEADSQLLNIIVMYDEGDDVGSLKAGMSSRLPPPKLRDAASAAMLVAAGTISVRVLSEELRAWLRQLKGKVIVCDARSPDGPVTIQPVAATNLEAISVILSDDVKIEVLKDGDPAKLVEALSAIAS